MQPLLPEEIELAEAELAEMLETGGPAGAGRPGGPSGGGFGSPDDDYLPGSEAFEPAEPSAAAGLDDLPELPAPDDDLASGFGSGEGGLGDLPELPAPDEDPPGSGFGSGSGPAGGPLLPEGEDDPLAGPGAGLATPFLCYVNLFLAQHYCHLYRESGEVAYLKRCRYYHARFVRCRG